MYLSDLLSFRTKNTLQTRTPTKIYYPQNSFTADVINAEGRYFNTPTFSSKSETTAPKIRNFLKYALNFTDFLQHNLMHSSLERIVSTTDFSYLYEEYSSQL